jgi:hypothetical protein
VYGDDPPPKKKKQTWIPTPNTDTLPAAPPLTDDEVKGLAFSLTNAWAMFGFMAVKSVGPEMGLEQNEAELLGSYSANVAKHWPGAVRAVGGPSLDIMNLVGAVGMIYRPKVLAYQHRILQMRAQAEREQREARFTAMNGNGPTAGPDGPTINPDLNAFGGQQPPPYMPPQPDEPRPWRNT